jgi:diacylglycerol O-acyltransferase
MGPDDDPFMRNTDALTWNMEHDPGLRSTIVSVTWMDARPDFEVLSARLDTVTRLVPRFRQRPVRPPGLFATPRWVDCDLDITLHLRRMVAPAPATAQTVLDFARIEAMTEFEPTRPLWAGTLIEGVEGDRCALVLKLHHSLTDGVGGVQLAMLLFDTTPDPAPVVRVPAPEPGPEPSGTDLTREAVAYGARRLASTARDGLDHLVPLVDTVAHHPLRTAFDVAATVSSLGRFVMPVAETLSPVMQGRGLGRHLAMIEVDLDDLKRSGVAVDATLNDAFVTSVTGGLRRYHEHHGTSVKELRMTMPVSMRRDDDPVGGNRITLERFTVPVGDADTGSRLRMTGWRCRAARYEEALPLSDVVAGLLNLLPSGVIGSMLKHVDFVASNVPGAPVPLFLAGAPVTGSYAFGPTTGAALNVTLVSYRRTCCIGCTIDTTAVPDPEVMMDCLRHGFDEVLDLGGGHRPAAIPVPAMRAPVADGPDVPLLRAMP